MAGHPDSTARARLALRVHDRSVEIDALLPDRRPARLDELVPALRELDGRAIVSRRLDGARPQRLTTGVETRLLKAGWLPSRLGRRPSQFPRRARTIGSPVKPTIEAYTVALPWYEPEDFPKLWALAHDRDEMPADYEAWHRQAVAVMNIWLARGRALEIVTIRPDEFIAWLTARNLPNTAETRRQYVEEQARHCHDVA